MSLPSTLELERVIVDIISSAQDDEQLGQLTVRIVRQKLATHFGLEEDDLNDEKYKSFIKTTVRTTVTSLETAPAPSSSGAKDASSPPKAAVSKKKPNVKSGSTTIEGAKKKTKGGSGSGSRKPRVESQVHAPLDEERAADVSESEAPPPPKKTSTSARSKPSKPTVKTSKVAQEPEGEAKFKSKAIIESSDDEAAPPKSGTQATTRSPRREHVATKPSTPKQKQQKVNKSDLDVEMDAIEPPGSSSSTSKPKLATKSPKSSVPKTKKSARDPTESDLSSVIDEPPKKRQKKQKQEKQGASKPQKDEKTKRGKKKEELSKDEETINRLKGIVVACGVRKVWKKEFEGLDKSSQQIKRLHTILGELGMTPRYSLEKARVIREERELAQELKDVQEFDNATKRRGGPHHSSPEAEGSVDQEGSDANAPVRKKQTARASIMAFLQDQSEEE